MPRCSICDKTKTELKKEGYIFDIRKCDKCKQWFCEACMVEDGGCPNCSDIVYI